MAKHNYKEDMSPKVTRMQVVENPSNQKNKTKGNHATVEMGTQEADFETILSD